MFLIPDVVQGRYFEGKISSPFGLPKCIREYELRNQGNLCLWYRNPGIFVESGFLSFGIQNSTQGIRNPANNWNPEYKFH